MMNKIFGVKNITHLLYGFLICMPMLSILARTCYVAINKNAKDSYSADQSLNYNLDNTENLYEGSMYYFKTNNNLMQSQTLAYVNIKSINVISGTIAIPSNPYRFRIYYNNNQSAYSLQIDGNNTLYTTIGNATTINSYQFTFISNEDATNPYTSNLLFYNFSTQQSLDNAFEYSLSQFTKDNNLGNVDIFSWFTNLFLDQTNPTNQLYLGFVNWYLNYTLLVSSGYLLFLTLIWFVNYVRRILDKSMNQEYGGF